jgi:acyl carrier protein
MEKSPSLPEPSSSNTVRKEPLCDFPEEVREAFRRLRETGDPAAADTVVLAIVAEHMPRKGVPISDQSALVADLGFDSFAITEMIFFVEELFEVSISNAEILGVSSVADLREFVRAKLASREPRPE